MYYSRFSITYSEYYKMKIHQKSLKFLWNSGGSSTYFTIKMTQLLYWQERSVPIYLGSARSTSLDYVTINPGFKGGQYAAHNTKQKLYTEEPRSDCPCESLEGITNPLSFWYSYKQTVSTYTRCFFCSKSPESGAVLAQSAISRA